MSVNTSEAYRVGIQAFEQFRIGQGLSLVWPPPDTHLNMFIAHLSIKHYKHSTAKSYIAAISFKCKSHTLYDPTKNFVTQKLLQGMRRSTNTADTRLPITLDIYKPLSQTFNLFAIAIMKPHCIRLPFPLHSMHYLG